MTSSSRIARTAAGSHSAHANGGSGINTVTEREERVGGHRGTFHLQTFVSRFNASDFASTRGSSGLRLPIVMFSSHTQWRGVDFHELGDLLRTAHRAVPAQSAGV